MPVRKEWWSCWRQRRSPADRRFGRRILRTLIGGYSPGQWLPLRVDALDYLRPPLPRAFADSYTRDMPAIPRLVRCAVSPRCARGVPEPVGARLDRHAARAASGRAHLHVLEIPAQRVCAGRGPANKPHSSESRRGTTSSICRRGSGGARLGTLKRSRAGVGHAQIS